LGKWRSVQNVLLKNKTVGIIGLGNIGSRVASMLKPFGTRILAYSPASPPKKPGRRGAELTGLETLLKESDFLTLPCRPDHRVERPHRRSPA